MPTPGLGPASRARPTTWTGTVVVGVTTRRASPRCTSRRAAVVASRAISPPAAGTRPWVIVGECGEGYQLWARVGAPLVGPTAVLVASMTVALETVTSP